jgi:hypothetical protein
LVYISSILLGWMELTILKKIMKDQLLQRVHLEHKDFKDIKKIEVANFACLTKVILHHTLELHVYMFCHYGRMTINILHR